MCKLIDFHIEESPNKKEVYLFSQAYNASLNDLYRTNRNENMKFSEEQLIEIAF